MRRSASSAWLVSKHERLFADKVMREEDWERHRSAIYRHGLQPIKLLRVLMGFGGVLIVVAIISVIVGVYCEVLVKRYGWPMVSLQAVQTVFSAITFALTLLLVFKTNNSYSRWWEARKDVGQLVSLAHNITRQAAAYFPADQPELVAALGRWAGSLMYVAKAAVRPSADLRQELGPVLLPQELEWLLEQPQKQLALGQALSSIVQAARIDSITRSRLDAMITLWTFEFGACGRIYNTSIPLCFTRHTSRFLTCYLFLLPLLLWPMCGWGTPALAVVIAFLLLGVENISVMVEEPFHVIAFDAFCPVIQRDVQNIVKMHSGAQVPVIGGLNSSATAENRSQPPLNFSMQSAAGELSRLPNGLTSTSAMGGDWGAGVADGVAAQQQSQQPQRHAGAGSGSSSRWSLEARKTSQHQHAPAGAAVQAVSGNPDSQARCSLPAASSNSSSTCLISQHVIASDAA